MIRGVAASGDVSRVAVCSGEAEVGRPPASAVVRRGGAFVVWFLIGGLTVASAQTGQPDLTRPTELVLEDQFDRKADLADLRGSVVILVYGDRKATEACRRIGEALHVYWHPQAKGQPPAKARAAPVVPLDTAKPGQISPDVLVVPVACCGKIPPPIRAAIRSQIARTVPDTVVWLDFDETLRSRFGQAAGEPNLLVFDTQGRLRGRWNGQPDAAALDRLVRQVQDLRREALR